VPGGKLAAVLGKATGAMWRGAMHYAGKGGGAASRWLGAKAGGLMQKAKDFLRRKPSAACGCFAAGTIVWTSHGAVPIEDVRVGDLVLAKDEQSGELVSRLVTAELVTRQAGCGCTTSDAELKMDFAARIRRSETRTYRLTWKGVMCIWWMR
jgi:hypothetical protein